MGRGCAVDGDGDLAVDQCDRQFVLCAGKAHRDSVLADKKRPRGQLGDDLLERVSIGYRSIACDALWLLGGNAECARQVVASPGDQSKRVFGRSAERARHGAQRLALRQQVHQPRKDQLAVIVFGSERHRERDREPVGR
jgi:hypothetical protein